MTKKFENVNELRSFISSLCFNNAVEAKEYFEDKIKRLEKEKHEIRDRLYELNCKMKQVKDWKPIGIEIDLHFDRLNEICNEVEQAKILIEFVEATETVCSECSGDKCLLAKDDESCSEEKSENTDKIEEEIEEIDPSAFEEEESKGLLNDNRVKEMLLNRERPPRKEVNPKQEESELHSPRPILRRVSIFIF